MKRLFFLSIALLLLVGCRSTPATISPAEPELVLTATKIPPTPVPVSTELEATLTPIPVSTDIVIPLPPVPSPEMILIPAGEFQMGCAPEHNGGFACPPDELPLRTVNLESFFIDKFEVTNTWYAECVAEGACNPPSNFSSATNTSYFDNPEFANYPVIYVTWNDANDYCAWAGKRLPTEAEWEKAARAALPIAYPWGDDEPACNLANMNNNATSSLCVGDASAVGSYPDGANEYGVMEMAGNVWEWVNDWYSEDYYATSPAENLQGPDDGTYKVLRGGGWSNNWVFLRTSSRGFDPVFNSSKDVGFRCALPANEN